MAASPETSAPDSVPLRHALGNIVREPVSILWRRWNWKASVLSIVFRAPDYLAASVRRGWRETFAALFVDSACGACTAGFYGAFVWAIRDAQPAWLRGLVITLFLPAVLQGVEYGVHWLRGTQHLHAVLLGSTAVSAVSSLFNWFVMKRGALLVAGEGTPFRRDLRRLPLLAVSFAITGPRWIWQRARNAQSQAANTESIGKQD